MFHDLNGFTVSRLHGKLGKSENRKNINQTLVSWFVWLHGLTASRTTRKIGKTQQIGNSENRFHGLNGFTVSRPHGNIGKS
jgi:hypothetical protein